MAESADTRITVVIPTFRRPAMLRRAIASVVAQQQPVLTCVYDNGADPTTQAVVSAFARQGQAIRYYAHPENIGANANFAFGLARVESEFFLILSDDDVLLPGLLDRAMAEFARNPQALFVASPVMLVDPSGQVLRLVGVWPPGCYEAPRGLLELARREHFTWTGTVFRRSALELAGNLDPEMGLLSDLDLLLRIAGRGPFAVVDEPGAIFSWHPNSNSSLPTLDQFWPAWQRIADKLRADAVLPGSVGVAAAQRLDSSRVAVAESARPVRLHPCWHGAITSLFVPRW
jgi:GT2 family glycosyltransferase